MNSEQITNKRIEWIDTAKGITTILVILGHMNDGPIIEWLYSFHLPVFFILSGCVFKSYDSFKDLFVRKCKTILVPYFCLGAVMAAFQVFLNICDGSFSIHSTLVIGVELVLQRRYWTLWFIACLFVLNLLFYPLEKHLSFVKETIAVVVITAVGLIYAKSDLPFLFWNADASLVACFFFYFGMLLRRNYSKIETWFIGNKSIIIFIIALGTNFISHYLNLQISGETLQMYNSLYGFIPLTLLGALSGSLFVIIASHWLNIGWLKYVGQNSLLYYAWHQQILIPIVSWIFIKLGLSIDGTLSAAVRTAIIVVAITGLNKIIVKSRVKWILGKW